MDFLSLPNKFVYFDTVFVNIQNQKYEEDTPWPSDLQCREAYKKCQFCHKYFEFFKIPYDLFLLFLQWYRSGMNYPSKWGSGWENDFYFIIIMYKIRSILISQRSYTIKIATLQITWYKLRNSTIYNCHQLPFTQEQALLTR